MIAASPEAVWAVLADFARYRQWNPLNLEAHGDAVLGPRSPWCSATWPRPSPGRRFRRP
uniref:SRPBCC family protein n=1 Tax=Phenylobacterium glaciei TaxID=2803784 RepID=A0A974P260_9CAUL|nr:SRPBCC family protein [Phenylobacterium glaciei]